VPLVIQDRTFNADGTLAYAPTSRDYRTGLMGDMLFVNGAAQPNFQVSTHKYRFRFGYLSPIPTRAPAIRRAVGTRQSATDSVNAANTRSGEALMTPTAVSARLIARP